MARKKRVTKSKIDKSRLLDDITTAKPGEFCYFIDRWKKIWWGEIQKILNEIKKEKRSERAGRLIDKDKIGSMELKKKDGYF